MIVPDWNAIGFHFGKMNAYCENCKELLIWAHWDYPTQPITEAWLTVRNSRPGGSAICHNSSEPGRLHLVDPLAELVYMARSEDEQNK